MAAAFPYTGFLDGVGYAAIPTGTTTVNVSSSSALTTALTNATAGQRIVLANATYSGSFTLTGKNGTASSGITIEAATQGGAVFAAGTTFVVNNCSYVTIKGLTFGYELSSGNVLGFRGTSNRCRVTRCTFGPTSIGSAGTTKATFVYGGDSVEHIRVDHNELRNKANPGNAILFDGNFTTLQACRHIRIDHNVVRSIRPEVDNEKEPIRLGVSTMSKTTSYSVVERNFFLDCICEPEIVSVKAGGVRVSGNTVLRSIGGLVYRHGTNGVMNDNYVVDRAGTFGTTIGSGGLRFYDANHEVSYNYVDGVFGGSFQNALMLDTGDAEGSSTNLSAHWRVVNALVERNVLVGNPTGIVIGDNYDSAPTGATIRDNIVAQAASGTAITQKIAPVSSTLTNNAYYPTPAGGGMVQGSDTIWRKAGFGPRLTYLQQADVGPNGDVNDTDGTGTLISGGGGTTPLPDPVDADTAAGRLGWGTPLGVSDEFEYTGAPASTKWGMYDGPGHSGNGRRVPTRATVANGKLIGTGLNNGDSFGMAHRFDQQYGRWEVRMRCFETGTVIEGNRYHVVLIIWPDSDEWPEDGEYDFVELSIPGQQTLGAFMHFPHDASASVQQREFNKSGVDTSQWHNYAFEWTPDHLKGFVDGVEWFSTSGGASSIRRDIQTMPSGHLTIQLDNFDGTNQTPASMEVEWVRVYTLTPAAPPASPQTVSTVGIPTREALGVPTVTGALPAPPSGSVVTRLGQNTVLGASTLGYTSGSVTPTPPGVQTVSGIGGIGTGQGFGTPVLTVADGPQTVSPAGIPPTTDFGRPRVSVGPPASPPAPGGVLVPTLFAVGTDGTTLTPLPAWQSMTLSPVRNSAGSVEVVYPAGAPGFQLLHDSVSASPLKACEIRVWLGGTATGAVGGWLVSKSGDDLEPGSPWRFSGHFHEWILSKAIIAPQPISEANKNGELRFAGATAGLILATVMDQAQARGALPLVSRDFTNTHDSNGNAWASSISSLKLAPKTTVAQVADKLVELGMCEYEITAGRVWRAFNPGGRGTDRTTGGPSPLTFAAGVDLSEAARRESMRDAGTAVLVAGSEGFYEWATSPTAQAQLGWRAEVGVDAGQLSSRSAVLAVAPGYLDTASSGVAEYSAAVELGLGAPIPVLDYAVGDWAYLSTGAGGSAGRERMRIAQIVLEFGRDAPARGKVVFNDLITDRLTALYRRLNAISTGDAVVGTSTPSDGGPGEDTIPPAAPTGVTVASTKAYQQPGESETYALVIVGWAPVTTNAYADAETADKVRAAGLIADRLYYGQGILEDWTWSGAPEVVGLYNDALLAEAQAAGLSGADDWMLAAAAQAWLDDYAVTHAGGGAVTDDVAHYRVQWRFTGSQVVPSRQDPGNGVPGEPVPPRDPNAFPEDADWTEPGESPTTATRIEFGAVLAGRAISVRVAAVDRAGNQGPWSTPVGVVTAIDNRPPPAPSKPIVAAWFRTMDVTWDGKGSSGEDLFAAAPDVTRGGGVEVHVDVGIDFTPDRPIGAGGTVDLSASRTYKATLYDAGTWNVVDLTIGTTYYARLVAVDRTGNASEPSATSDGVLPQQLVTIDIGPNAIARQQIIDGEIVRAKIADAAINSAKVEEIEVGKLRAGTMTAQVILGGRFSTPVSASGHQVQFDSGGWRMYRGGTVIGRWETFDGSMLVTGQYNSAVTGQRIVVNPGGGNPDTIRFYPTFSDVYSSIDSMDFAGGAIAGIRIVGSGTTTTANKGMVVVRDQYASLVHGRTDLSYWGSEIWVEQNFTRNKSATVDLIVDERLAPLSGPRRVAMIHYNSAGQPINATGLYYQKTSFNGGEPHFYANGMDVGFVFAPGLIYVRNNPNGDFRDLTCRTLNQASGAVYKRGVRDLGGQSTDARRMGTKVPGAPGDKLDDPLSLLRRSRPRRYRWHDDADDGPERAGFVAEEMPYPIRVTDVHPSTDGDEPDSVVESIDYSALVAVLTAAMKQMDQRLLALEAHHEERNA